MLTFKRFYPFSAFCNILSLNIFYFSNEKQAPPHKYFKVIFFKSYVP